ncbi:hypothetical protein [Klebsiella quasipneumoniae]|uniref:hypothetical protein n=1 Tax=Klebsiella quasipneumoniae TaxID=1463165 RepID=UPI0019203B25|nr:hypothetical protein [Klebsiella quasipneumoniae]HCI6434077.1 hypothetical protein [Klebsiella quasipneumoniae subsp. similipneumoniae]
MKLLCFVLAMIVSMPSISAIQCGNYTMTGEGMTGINGETVTSQKIKFLGKDGDYVNMKMDMGLMPSRDGNNYGFSSVKRNGKAFSNVQPLQNSMDALKVIWSFPCKKVDG